MLWNALLVILISIQQIYSVIPCLKTMVVGQDFQKATLHQMETDHQEPEIITLPLRCPVIKVAAIQPKQRMIHLTTTKFGD
ncbi:MAG: hypothetical protein A2315_16460 [Ignavibacteria bacterium RIFOXYB2_FULL_35_12]|nr:MAG: hypothetical protein A2058_11955 [Ignavibacteria bacterium GWA2_36_19]OGU49353.1 MAG: hypothetical protein A2006_12000 [Ignavibacteria bacterium GWC2_35_8]OGU61283.1 MAG: hypothetical protein A2X60_13375 [Ignavibacteria bacterium GWF2_35_20]OGU81074.1 MAG: hypothetical protein A2W11_03905 [Ignavibacteria bacterium RBG_16_35_7]OGU84119.1 MAG: hypothetical protein A3K31_10980 [Ignavibacteria bacterium RIFOXYA12_FULL_35_25]OGU92234.1 MAG: hypothetical protein A2492_13975 [Ignavibacteria b